MGACFLALITVTCHKISSLLATINDYGGCGGMNRVCLNSIKETCKANKTCSCVPWLWPVSQFEDETDGTHMNNFQMIWIFVGDQFHRQSGDQTLH